MSDTFLRICIIDQSMSCSDVLERKAKEVLELIPVVVEEALDCFETFAVLLVPSFFPVLLLTILLAGDSAQKSF